MNEKDTFIVLELKADPLKAQDAVRTVIETESGKKIGFSVILGDIARVDADAIVCPTDPGFAPHPGGVHSAIERAAGKEIFQEAHQKAVEYLEKTGGVPYKNLGIPATPLGFAIATSTGKMERPHAIIHVNNMHVDRDKPNGCDEEAVEASVKSSLMIAEQADNIRSVAFPAIGTGLWLMELDESLRATIKGAKKYLSKNPNSKIEKVSYVIYDEVTTENARNVQSLLFNKVYPSLEKK